MWININKLMNTRINLLNSLIIRNKELLRFNNIKNDFLYKYNSNLILYNNYIYKRNIGNIKLIKNNNKLDIKKNLIIDILKKSKIIDDKEIKTMKMVSKYLWPKNKEYRKRIILSLISLCIAKLATIQVPLLLSRLIDKLGIITSYDKPYSLINRINVLYLIGSYGIARICSSGFNEFRNALFCIVSQAACKDISLKCFNHFHNNLDINFIQNHRSGELLTIITRGFKSISQLLNIMIFQIIPTTAEFILVLGILLKKVGLEAALITLSTMIAYMEFTRRITHKRTIYRKEMNNSEQKSNGLLSDSLINAETLKYLNSENYIYDLYSKYQQIYMNSNIKVQKSLAILNFGQNFIFTSGLLSTMLLTTNKILLGKIPLSSIVLVTSLLFQLAIPLNHIGVIYRETKLTMIDLNKLNKYLNIKNNKDNILIDNNIKDKYINPIDLYNNIELKDNFYNNNKSLIKLDNISFGFPINNENKDIKKRNINNNNGIDNNMHVDNNNNNNNNNKMIINNLSLDIPLGKKIGIVGSSGSGKTTLSKLIFKIFNPINGNIKFFNKNINDFEINEYRKCFSILPQDILLLNMSIIDNLKLANNNISMNEIIAACKLAGIHDNIIKMNKGYETIVGERGSILSGGEKQRLGFARLLIKKSPIWILDEPTSALDLINHNFFIKMLTNIHFHSISKNNIDNKFIKYKNIFDLIKSKNNEKENNDIINLIEQIIKLPLTIIVIAHRLSTVKNFDLIAYLEDGNIKEIGNHNDLIKNQMYYYQLWNKQHIDNIIK